MLFLSQFAIIQLMKPRYIVWGKIQAGKKRGKSLGFPTANVALHKNITEGVYLSRVKIDNNTLSALTFIGVAKTFGEKNKLIESYILNFNKNIYGKWMTVMLFNKIRGNIKFKSEKELVEQIKKDLVVAKQFLENLK